MIGGCQCECEMIEVETGSFIGVSVITPFLNGNEFMDEAISSVLAQTYRSWELLLVDDGSSDESTAKAKRYAGIYPEKIQYLEHPGHENCGQGPSRNLANRHARGKYLAFLDVDDIWLPNKLTNQVQALDFNPEAAMTYGPYFFWYGWTGQPEDLDRDKQCDVGSGREYDTLVPCPAMLIRHIEKGNGLPVPCSTLVLRAAFEAVGGFEEEFPGMYDDEALFAKLAIHYPVFITTGCWDRYRQHHNSFCARALRNGEWDPGRNASSPDRVRFLLWLARYIENCSHNPGPGLLAAVYGRINELENLL